MAEVISEHRISDRAFVAAYGAAAVAGLVILLATFLLAQPLLAILTPLPALGVFIYSRLARVGSSYRLYPDRLEIESGILARKIENVELFRVRDVGLRQGLVGRMLNFGDIYIHSTDSSTPDMHVRAIDAPKDLYLQIRELVSSHRSLNRTLIVEEGHALPEP